MTLKVSSFVGVAVILFILVEMPPSVVSKPNAKSFGFLEGSEKGKTVKGIYQLKQYLTKFGYLDYGEHATHANDDEFDEVLESALKTYQLNYRLKTTGILDSQTVNQMMKPRCGFPDIINGTTRMRSGSQHGPLSVSLYNFLGSKWPPSQTHLTYTFPSSIQLLDLQILKPVIARAFGKWADVSQFTFAEAEDGSSADITIGFENIDGPGPILAYGRPPTSGVFRYDAYQNWSTNPDISQFEFDLESLALHEIGHLLGLAHSDIPAAIMHSGIAPGEIRRALQEDDIQGIHALYA